MRGALHRAWHSPRSGPVLLLVAGFPVLVVIGILASFPLVALIELGRAALTPGRVPFARTSLAYLWFGGIGWAVILLASAQARRIARANRGLDAQVTVGLPRGIRSPYRVAARLRRRLAACGCAVSEVIREDYGAGIWLTAGADRFWLAVSGEAGAAEAVVSLAYEPGIDLRRRLTRRADQVTFRALLARLQEAIAADPALDTGGSPGRG